jgi:amino acid permease
MAKKNVDILSVVGLFLMLVAILAFTFSPLISFIFVFLFMVVGYFILKRNNKKLKFTGYMVFFLVMFSLMLFVIVLENLNNIFHTDNKLVAVFISLIPSFVYYVAEKRTGE